MFVRVYGHLLEQIIKSDDHDNSSKRMNVYLFVQDDPMKDFAEDLDAYPLGNLGNQFLEDDDDDDDDEWEDKNHWNQDQVSQLQFVI